MQQQQNLSRAPLYCAADRLHVTRGCVAHSTDGTTPHVILLLVREPQFESLRAVADGCGRGGGRMLESCRVKGTGRAKEILNACMELRQDLMEGGVEGGVDKVACVCYDT
eukprot:CAMPEP_0179430902 /NCGR_PEP_ID=MMETSP0799-20121207/15917_1 /TAXON_ID=46947 /ORGANISM="Geminigera cryophila, Strain CCMP2564" /LENGTH=109 /DNA_ID=CAMNT_0021207547 /DNA_START=663 /DNA_END=992 /DNA_ORIENTATION=-